MAVGDALGVPVEFRSRKFLSGNPVKDMIGYGSHNQPPGTWSDDSSLAFCLAEALTGEFSLDTVAKNFQKWYFNEFWTADEEVFDIGSGTAEAILRLKRGVNPEKAGGTDESSNGNGSLMRILPLLFHVRNKSVNERFRLTRQVSSITHGHIRSVTACFYYLEFAGQILKGKEKSEIYRELQAGLPSLLTDFGVDPAETAHFDRLLRHDISSLPAEEIRSGGYVIDTLEASVWCLLTTQSYSEAVLKAVNLGWDTDTTGAVTGGLAGLLYGIEGIPERWLSQIARRDDIENLANRMADFLA